MEKAKVNDMHRNQTGVTKSYVILPFSNILIPHYLQLFYPSG